MSDLHRIYAIQAVRAFVYGFGSVMLGASLERSGFSGAEVGFIFAALLAGSALVSLALVRRADRMGRRRLYAALLAGMGVSGTIFALTDSFPFLVIAALTGTLSVEVVESGPFTSIEQAMVPAAAGGSQGSARTFGVYNAIAAVVGSAGALAAGGPEILRRAFPGAPIGQRWLLVYPVAAAVALVIMGACPRPWKRDVGWNPARPFVGPGSPSFAWPGCSPWTHSRAGSWSSPSSSSGSPGSSGHRPN